MAGHLYDEGHTVAGWVGTGIATVGSVVVGLGVCVVSGPLVGGGLAVVALSALVTWALHLRGWGKPPGARPRAEWGMRVRDSGARGGHPGCLGCRMAGRGARAGGVVGGGEGAGRVAVGSTEGSPGGVG
jgi:hypothetical protein